ncbi:MAG: hypothetical protein IJF80_04520 [Clostridia bacterium]|nr:hypothetical protein [Clostridia bacterium]
MGNKVKNAITAFFAPSSKGKGINDYEIYLSAQKEKHTKQDFEYKPLISVVVNRADKKLKASLEKQDYDNWELVQNGEKTSGDFVLLLTDDCVLEEDALSCFAAEINKNARIDMIYSDEDEINEKQERVNPLFKPDYSEITLLSYNFIGAAMLISKEIFAKLSDADLSNEDSLYDTALRCVAYSDVIIHIKKVLVSRRKKRGVISKEGGLYAIKSYLQYRRRSMLMDEGLVKGTFCVQEVSKKKKSLGIVIVSGGDILALRRLLESIEECVFHMTKKIVVIRFGINDAREKAYCDLLEKSGAVKMIYSEERNYSKLCNVGARENDCDVLMFLNPNMEIISPFHIKNLMENLNSEKVGAVACKIVDKGGKLSDCGITVGLDGTYGCLYTGEKNDFEDDVKNRFVNVKREVTAVSANSFTIRRDVFFDAGGFDETIKTPDAAIELSLRLKRRGFFNVYDPRAVMIKHEDGFEWERSENDKIRMYDALRQMLITGDPCYNPNYDYACLIPMVAVNVYPPIELNENYSK